MLRHLLTRSGLVLAAVAVTLAASSQARTAPRNSHRGTRVSQGSAPFTQSWTQMQAHGAQLQRHPRGVRRDLLRERDLHREGSRQPAREARQFDPPTGGPVQTVGTYFFGGDRIDALHENQDAIFQVPPDTMGAIGTKYYLQVINNTVRAFTRNGVEVGRTILDAFFSVSAGGISYPRLFTTDPKVLFDRRTGRWIACCIEFDPTSSTTLHENDILLAVSRTDDPLGTWDKYVLPAGVPDQDGKLFFNDFPTLGIDDTGLYIGLNTFVSDADGNPVDPFIYGKTVVVRKQTLLGEHPYLGPVFTFDTSDLITPWAANNQDGTGPAWVVGNDPNAWGTFHFSSITWDASGPSMSDTGTLATATYGAPIPALTKDSPIGIDSGDDRLFSPVIRNGRLWTCRNSGVNATGSVNVPGEDPHGDGDRVAVEWFELDVSSYNPVILQTGRIFDPADSDPASYYYGSAMVNGRGEVAIGFSGSKASGYAGAYASGRSASDPPGAMSAPVLVKRGEGAYHVAIPGVDADRWGDFSATSLDPLDDLTFWTTQEYARQTSPTVGGVWGTVIAQLVVAPPTLTSVAGIGYPGQLGATATLTGTGFFDPGSGYASRPYAQLAEGRPPYVPGSYRTTVTAPTTAMVTMDISIGSAQGPRTMLFTNPDGQTTAGSGFVVGRPGGTIVVPARHSFGAVRKGASWDMPVRNTGPLPLLVTPVSADAPFTVGRSSIVVAPGKSGILEVDFDPKRVGVVTGVLTLETSDPRHLRAQVQLQGSGRNGR